MTPKTLIVSLSETISEQVSKLTPDDQFLDRFQDNFRRMTRRFDSPGPEVRMTESFAVDGVKVQLFVPFGPLPDVGPTLIYAHGGGFVTCDTETHEGIIRRLANASLCRVLSVEYRLAPEHPFPAAPDDVKTVLDWALSGQGEPRGIDAGQLALAGDSAGANITAWLSQVYRDRIKAQLLFYPLMQLKDVKPANPGPQDWLNIGTVALKYIQDHYVCGADPMNPKVSPLFEKDLDGLPPAFVLTCGLDPLRDEGKLYADKMEEAGVTVQHWYEKTMPHGFLNFAKAFPKAQTLPIEAAEFLRAQFPSLPQSTSRP
ncbi:alpha/beta hydrolase [uncultured Algimonas sp.]|uniref:alpha/beta hydrolase n=1 Tax=uncultured Algimonas sp. TaxID=1547920 RepID=UPI0026043ADF|nr:alpha/beta hydrolase [uncultured Algimonas sp.]